MAHSISIYARSIDLHNHEYFKLYHKTKIGLKEDEKYDLSKKMKTSAQNFALQAKHYIGTKS